MSSINTGLKSSSENIISEQYTSQVRNFRKRELNPFFDKIKSSSRDDNRQTTSIDRSKRFRLIGSSNTFNEQTSISGEQIKQLTNSKLDSLHQSLSTTKDNTDLSETSHQNTQEELAEQLKNQSSSLDERLFSSSQNRSPFSDSSSLNHTIASSTTSNKDIITPKEAAKKDRKITLFTTLCNCEDEAIFLSSTLKKIILQWKAIAQEREYSAKKLRLPEDRIKLAKSSHNIISMMETHQNTSGTYIAYDALNRLQAIAYTKMTEKKGQKNIEIECMATHPNNLEIFGNENPIRGAGTALIKNIAIDALKNKGIIYLEKIESAIPFYKKLGFVECYDEKNPRSFEELILKNRGIKSLLESQKDLGIVVTTPPETLT